MRPVSKFAAGFPAVVAAVIGIGFSSSSFAAAFTSGNIVVTQVGDGSAALNSNATAAFVLELTPAGASVQSIALPTSASGANKPLTFSGSATSEGFITLSANGKYLTVGGYPQALGTASVTSSTGGRTVGLIDMSGNVDTSTLLGDTSSIGNIRSVVSDDGTQFWAASSSGGVRYTTYGSAGASTQLSTSPANTRVVNISGGQLYTSAASGTFQGVASLGTGLPTTSGQTTTLFAGFPTATGPSSYDYLFADPSTLYVADDRTNSNGGIQKWVLSDGTWSLKYTLSTAANIGMRGLAGAADGTGNEVLYAVTTDNKLVTISDAISSLTLPSLSFTTLATAPTNTAFRGVEIIPAVPEPASLSLLALAAAPLLRRRSGR